MSTGRKARANAAKAAVRDVTAAAVTDRNSFQVENENRASLRDRVAEEQDAQARSSPGEEPHPISSDALGA